MADDEHDRDAAEILRAIDRERSRAVDMLSPSARLLYVIWGIAWIVGFTALFLAVFPDAQPALPVVAAAVIGGVALVGGMVVSAVHSARKGAGTRGPSMVQGAVYGNAYAIAFIFVVLLGWRLTSAGVPLDVMLTYWVAALCLVIGVLALVGSVLWDDRSQLTFGIWTLLSGLLSLALPAPYQLLAGVVGGLGFLVLALIESIRPTLTCGPIVRNAHG